MPYEIGRAFSPEVLASLDRNRDRAQRGGPARRRSTSTPVTSLQEAMLRAAQDDREANLRADLAREGLASEERRHAGDLGARAANREIDLLDLDRKREADLAAAGSREGALAIRGQEAADRASRYDARSKYERGVLGVRQQEVDVAAARAALQAEDQEHRRAIDGAKTSQQALEVVRRLRDSAFKPDESGQISPERVARYADLLRHAHMMFTDEPEAGGRGLAGKERIAAEVSKTLARLAATQGLPGVTEGDGPDGLLDVALDEDDGPPRLGD